MRADALERRNAIVGAARAVFTQRGHDAPLDAVAELANVGIATLYRNFPTREDLVTAVAIATLTDAREAAETALAGMPTDPALAWHRLVDRLVELRLGALIPALVVHSFTELPLEVLAARELTKTQMSAAIGAAQAAGLVRADLLPLEFVIALAKLTRPQIELSDDAMPNLVPRLVAVFVAGLRPDGTDLPV
ncbi:TetR/AcrR family transcriptional regulator [Rhodococcus sp. IEGM 1379]|uniref:TetR/AcrR family transcriptional regulator n=1 Tax=Rhodococcus sp. IEGM 1379 TaxID=3047086 RepID=UPI0024B6B14C|nr:TetR/AcrR family transcriptional regulator [Rhodococcus sp. IEGM 1379]MDI9915147.1 helix-turn-helix domain-containing protein [Rhodococcus sp. IEGM 1379]